MLRAFARNLTVQVLTAIVLGAVIGALWPQVGVGLQPLREGFIRLVRMVVGPIIFLTVSVGIASMGDLKKIGRVGGKALLYFEIVTTLALAIGLLIGNLGQPGAGITARPSDADKSKIAGYVATAKEHSFAQFLLHIIPENVVGAFAQGDLLQILFFAVLFGLALAMHAHRHRNILNALQQLTHVLFQVVALIMKVAPLGALGAMAVTVGEHGIQALWPLAKLMACVYATMALFIFGVLGPICRLFGFSLWRFLVYIRQEIVLVLGTSSSESALPRLIEKLERFGCGREVVRLVVPAGYSFNLDGTSIYLSMAVLFIAQVYGIPFGLRDQLYVMVLLMLTSKGSAAVTGGGFVTLAATLTATQVLPVEGLGLLLGVDRFMSEARAITNLIGNGVATVVVSKLEGEFDPERYAKAHSEGGSAHIENAASVARQPLPPTPLPQRERGASLGE
jgi:aerobic C4-dicarboxylate transport protein